MQKKLTTRKICLLAVFTAITVILGIYMTFRIGNQIKVPIKFITVFMTGAIFGPLYAGLSAAIADILNALLVPVGPIMPQITAVEFCYGLIFGAFFYRAEDNRLYYVRGVICSLIQFIISIFLMSWILTDIGYFSSLNAAIIIRLPAAIITFLIHVSAICVMRRFIFRLKKYIMKEEI